MGTERDITHVDSNKRDLNRVGVILDSLSWEGEKTYMRRAVFLLKYPWPIKIGFYSLPKQFCSFPK